MKEYERSKWPNRSWTRKGWYISAIQSARFFFALLEFQWAISLQHWEKLRLILELDLQAWALVKTPPNTGCQSQSLNLWVCEYACWKTMLKQSNLWNSQSFQWQDPVSLWAFHFFTPFNITSGRPPPQKRKVVQRHQSFFFRYMIYLILKHFAQFLVNNFGQFFHIIVMWTWAIFPAVESHPVDHQDMLVNSASASIRSLVGGVEIRISPKKLRNGYDFWIVMNWGTGNSNIFFKDIIPNFGEMSWKIWRIFFKWVETTNYSKLLCVLRGTVPPRNWPLPFTSMFGVQNANFSGCKSTPLY